MSNEQCSEHPKNISKYNLCKCNSASSSSGYSHRDVSKCMIALPTTLNMFRAFKKILIGGCSCLNARLAIDTKAFIEDKGNEKLLFNLNIDDKKQ